MQKKLNEGDNLIDNYQLHFLAVIKTWHEDAECITIKNHLCIGYNVIEAARQLLPQPVDDDIDYINHGEIAIVSKPGVPYVYRDYIYAKITGVRSATTTAP